MGEKVMMDIVDALEWVKMAIRNGQGDLAVDMIEDLQTQFAEKKCEDE